MCRVKIQLACTTIPGTHLLNINCMYCYGLSHDFIKEVNMYYLLSQSTSCFCSMHINIRKCTKKQNRFSCVSILKLKLYFNRSRSFEGQNCLKVKVTWLSIEYECQCHLKSLVYEGQGHINVKVIWRSKVYEGNWWSEGQGQGSICHHNNQTVS